MNEKKKLDDRELTSVSGGRFQVINNNTIIFYDDRTGAPIGCFGRDQIDEAKAMAASMGISLEFLNW